VRCGTVVIFCTIRDTKFTQSFRAIIASGRVEPLALPVRRPGPECLYSERWVRSVKEWRKWADSCDPRPITKPRDMYEPDLDIDNLKLKARNFR
jgi:hypothetical protein